MMMKQELIEQINELRTCKGWNDKFADVTDMVSREDVLKLVEQLSEPKKVIIPKLVADWLQVHDLREDTKGKQSLLNILDNLNHDFENGYHKEVKEWIYENGDTFTRAWLDGYEVEKEQLYTVELPNPHYGGWTHIILYKNERGLITIDVAPDDDWRLDPGCQLTEADIKKEYEWAWQFAEKVEDV